MSEQCSRSTGRRYPLTLVCAVYRVPRATVYAQVARAAALDPVEGAKRGPKTAVSDAGLVLAIRAVLAAAPFHGEGHRKVHVRLRQAAWLSAATASCG